MKLDGFEVRVHGLFALIIAFAVFMAAYKIGQMGMLNRFPLFGGGGNQG